MDGRVQIGRLLDQAEAWKIRYICHETLRQVQLESKRVHQISTTKSRSTERGTWVAKTFRLLRKEQGGATSAMTAVSMPLWKEGLLVQGWDAPLTRHGSPRDNNGRSGRCGREGCDCWRRETSLDREALQRRRGWAMLGAQWGNHCLPPPPPPSLLH